MGFLPPLLLALSALSITPSGESGSLPNTKFAITLLNREQNISQERCSVCYAELYFVNAIVNST